MADDKQYITIQELKQVISKIIDRPIEYKNYRGNPDKIAIGLEIERVVRKVNDFIGNPQILDLGTYSPFIIDRETPSWQVDLWEPFLDFNGGMTLDNMKNIIWIILKSRQIGFSYVLFRLYTALAMFTEKKRLVIGTKDKTWIQQIIIPYAQEVLPYLLLEKKDKNEMFDGANVTGKLLAYDGRMLAFMFPTLSTIQLLGLDTMNNKNRGKGGLSLVGVDEAAYVNNAAVLANVLQPMVNAVEGSFIYGSTPNGDNWFKNVSERAKNTKGGNYNFGFYDLYTSGSYTEKRCDEIILNAYNAHYDIDPTQTVDEIAGKIAQEYFCFPPGTEIITSDGIKNIEDVGIDDFVMTHTNRYRKVKKLIIREYDGLLYRFKTLGNTLDLVCTPDHPVCVCNDGINNQWKAAKDILPTDRLTMPKPVLGKNKVITEDCAKIIGWYIAEGSCGRNNIQFTFNENEDVYIEELRECFKNEYGKDIFVQHNKANHSKQVIINNKEVQQFLFLNCGSGAINKKIPFSLITGHEQIIFDRLMLGDGHLYQQKNYKRYMFGTISKDLAYQVQILSHTIGYGASVLRTKGRGEYLIQGRKINTSDRIIYSVNITKSRKNYHIHKYNVSVPIKSITTEEYEGPVYNLTVQYDESYIANSRVVHNCHFNLTDTIHYFYPKYVARQEDYAFPQHYLDFSDRSKFEIYLSIDYGGTNDQMAVLFAAIDRNGIVYAFDELYLKGKGIQETVDLINEKLEYYKVKPYATFIDRSTNNTSVKINSLTSIKIAQLFDEYGLMVTPVKAMAKIDRINIVDEYLSIHSGIAHPFIVNKTETPKFFISDNCVNLKKEMRTLKMNVFSVDEQGNKKKVNFQKIKNDHLSDTVLYLLSEISGYKVVRSDDLRERKLSIAKSPIISHNSIVQKKRFISSQPLQPKRPKITRLF